MRLEVGKNYVTRHGSIVTIVEIDNSYTHGGYRYPYKGDNGLYYTDNGRFFIGGDGNHEDVDDLVKEHKEDDCMKENETIDKEYVIECIDLLIDCLGNDINLINNTGGSELAVNAINHCISKIKEAFSEIM